MSVMNKIFKSLSAQRQEERRAELHRNLIRHEARIGGQLFGSVPAGRRREFFCLDTHTWIWHEEWSDSDGQRRIRTTRYDIRPTTVLKAQDGHYRELTDDEAVNFAEAVKLYTDRIGKEIYNFV